ncbi:MAG TPA: hypothetical protein VNQ48_00235 [Microbacteriaceae bacterium]|nr:hypothetical protein [Microbacteriaceae bacterium]
MTATATPPRRRRAPAKPKPVPRIQPTLLDLRDEATWLEWRSLIPEPYQATELVTTEQGRLEFLEGARLLRVDKMPRAADGLQGPTPIQLAIADMLNAGYFLNGVLEPRRTTKTTSIEAVILGRCSKREDHVAGWTLATTGQKARERFLRDIVAPINRLYPNPKRRPFDVNIGKGSESITWPNGSYLAVYAPGGDGFRSGGFDTAWVDEGGEAEPDLGADITVAVLPTMDTKPGAQFIVSGTAPSYTDGNLLWDTLTDPTAGIIRHSAPENTDPEELEAWEPDADHPRAKVRALVEQYHPGVGWTTPIESVQRNYEKFRKLGKPELFAAEYLGIPGAEGATERIIPPGPWERGALDGELPGVPAGFTLAIAIHPDGLWASVGVAWHLEPEQDLVTEALAAAGEHVDPGPQRTAIGLLHHQAGVQGFAKQVLLLARKHRVPIIYDQASQAAGVEIETLARATPKPTIIPATTLDVRRGATKMLKLLGSKPGEGTLVHYRKQAQLERAAELAIKRQIGTYGGFGFGRPKADFAADITPLEACSLALQFLDDAATPVAPADALHF